VLEDLKHGRDIKYGEWGKDENGVVIEYEGKEYFEMDARSGSSYYPKALSLCGKMMAIQSYADGQSRCKPYLAVIYLDGESRVDGQDDGNEERERRN